MNITQKALYLLSPKEKRRGSLVLGLVIIMAALETAGVASVMPFLGVVGNPGIVRTNPILAMVYDAAGFPSVDTFLLALGGVSFAAILFSALFRILTQYAMNRFIELRRHTIGERLLETYLRQPYVFFLNRHSGDMATSILSEVDELAVNVFRPGMQIIAYGIVVLALVILLVVVDPALAGSVAAIIGGCYAAIFVGVRGVLGRVGKERAQANKERFTAASEALAGIKDIKLLGREHAYLLRFRGPSMRQAMNQATNQTLSQVPRALIEAVGFGGVIILSLVLLSNKGGAGQGGLGEVLPLLGLYAFAGYRLLPAAQQVYQGMTKLRFGGAAVDGVYADLRERTTLAEIRNEAAPLMARKSVALEALSYTYPNAPEPALHHIELSIPVGSSVGLVGSTGAGKTTLVDVILGLLRPTHGTITVDGEAVTDANLRNWQRALGYVPQEIFLTDSSVAENIALGIPPERIDHEQVIRAARMAQIHDFIVENLPQQYGTLVGERGVRLSGGQRQRIGIARALYHDPAVLVFDEATSALDNVTEDAVMESVKALSHKKTMIIIAHRLSTVKECDKIVVLERGTIHAQGTYQELISKNKKFREMAGGRNSR